MIVAIGCCAGGLLLACSEDSAAPSPAGDASTQEDASGVADTGTSDAGIPGADGGDASADAGPNVTSELGTTARIRIFNDAVFAEFREDDLIVRASNAPECVLYVSSASKPFSEAGELTIGGSQIVGADGGPSAPVVIAPTQNPAGFVYEYFEGPLFPADAQLLVEVEGDGTPSVPALPVQSLITPPAASIEVTQPTAPDGGGELVVPVTAPLQFTWPPPSGQAADQRLIIDVQELQGISNAAKKANLHCAFPLAQGQASIPANLLAEVKHRLGGNFVGQVYVTTGGAKEATPTGASYVLWATRTDSTNLGAVPLNVRVE